MNFGNLSQHIRVDPFPHGPQSVIGVTLISHIGDDLVLCFCLTKGTGFPDVVGKWFLSVHVKAPFHCGHRGGKVGMIGCADHNRINSLPHLVKHHAEILKGLRRPNFGEPFCVHQGSAGIDIAECDDVLRLQGRIGHRRNASRSNHGHVQFTVGGRPGLTNTELRQRAGSSSGNTGFQKASTGNWFHESIFQC